MLTSMTTALKSAQRSPTLSLMDVNYMNITEIFISFNIQHFQKISNFGNLNFVIKTDASHDETTCPLLTSKH